VNTTTTTAKSFSLQFYGNGAGGQKDVGAITIIPTDGNFGYSAMAFSVRGPFGAGSSEAVAEVMRFSRDGTTPCVGIGITNPTKPLVVNRIAGGGDNNPAIMIGNNGVSGGLRFQTYDLVSNPIAYMGLGTDMGGNSYEHSLVFSAAGGGGRQTIGSYDGTTYSTKMTILGSGIVQIPNQPAFSATRTAGNISAAQTIIFDTAWINRGSCYSTSTGLFTAPVAGLYCFTFFCITNSTAGIFVQFFKNGGSVNGGGNPFNSNGNVANMGVSATNIISLAANDTVNMNLAGGTMYGSPGNYHNNFCGYLLG
jgi:hypothetical protein